MEYNYLPSTNIKVSKICLGTMTWGRQNNIDEAFDQMNYSLDNGVNFFDTAELYPVPATLQVQDLILHTLEKQDLKVIQLKKLLMEV